MNLSLLRSLVQGEWRAHPVRAVVALAAIHLNNRCGPLHCSLACALHARTEVSVCVGYWVLVSLKAHWLRRRSNRTLIFLTSSTPRDQQFRLVKF